ncbi:PEP-CTERM sorting domain-containing protein [Massilia antarctica]|uniref:PEP-CTERM sorting domain-containing protein n=1 Tax=Massilia antarctica TaxID=2765360 RepID=UPI0006BB6888|nr:PEP-CTERM sorting domain-containing protein [Massilia sp. H27-R4]MCY0912269.1 PEP-CTERM sorting domain-containing protein [Massilia sp. H27-R4]CUI06233.1 Flagellar hook-length control protein FliK [Janthinobacterium sp. CG23_2]CUU30019.1 Flagellar hook-length control protein FliK [Janthinobacterium sp. CG23_2]
MTNRGKSLLAVVCALACANPALAQIGARTSIGNVRYILTDLDPNDGIAPSLSPLASAPLAMTSLVTTETYDGLRHAYSPHSLEGDTPMAPVADAQSYLSAPDGRPLTQLDSAAKVEGGSLSGMSLETSAYNNASVGYLHVASGAQVNMAPFILSPMTSITFSIDYAFDSAIGPLPDGLTYTQIYSSVAFTFVVTPPGDYIGVADGATYMYGENMQGTAGPGILNVSYDNRVANDMVSYVSFNSWTTATSNIPAPVPEPMTWAMLLAGLGIVVAARRRA